MLCGPHQGGAHRSGRPSGHLRRTQHGVYRHIRCPYRYRSHFGNEEEHLRIHAADMHARPCGREHGRPRYEGRAVCTNRKLSEETRLQDNLRKSQKFFGRWLQYVQLPLPTEQAGGEGSCSDEAYGCYIGHIRKAEIGDGRSFLAGHSDQRADSRGGDNARLLHGGGGEHHESCKLQHRGWRFKPENTARSDQDEEHLYNRPAHGACGAREDAYVHSFNRFRNAQALYPEREAGQNALAFHIPYRGYVEPEDCAFHRDGRYHRCIYGDCGSAYLADTVLSCKPRLYPPQGQA